MESRKPPNADLIAIYRLEFYKKQKRWKLSSDVKKIKRENNTKVRNQLDKTYDVTVPKTESCELNNAFLESEPDKSNTVLTSQWSQRNVPKVTKCSSYKRQTITSTWRGNEQEQHGFGSNVHTQRLPGAGSEVTLGDNITCSQAERDCSGFNGYFEYNTRWPDNDNWISTTELDELWCNDLPENVNGQYCGDSSTNMLTSGDCARDGPWLPEDENLRWIRENLYSSIGAEGWCEGSERSADSWGDFMRGADVAPHSSEVELTVPDTITEESLATLSSAQLGAAVRAHTRLLCSLLREERLRRRNRSRLSLTACTSSRALFSPRPATVGTNYERPTHDYEPSVYHTTINSLQRERTFTKTFDDDFVAGSHTNGDLELLGRGRGRLQSAGGAGVRGVVGVGRGRPVRL